jgi:protein-disulfide isomerase
MEANNQNPPEARWRAILDVAVAVAVLMAAAIVIYSFFMGPVGPARAAATPELPVPAAPVPIGGPSVKGSPDARVVLIGYSDFQCPFCAAFTRDSLPLIQEKYIDTGKVRFAFKHLPLPMHQHAVAAAKAAECAGHQGKFWPMHDHLFAGSTRLDQAIAEAVPQLGLDAEAFGACLDEGATTTKVQEDRAEAGSFQITSTPTFLLGTLDPDGRVSVLRRIPGAVPARVFEAAIDQVLQKPGS